MIPLPDSKKLPKEFFCIKCQKHKHGRLFSHKIKNRSYCTACSLPIAEQEKIGIMSPYSNTTTQQASINYAGKAYTKPLSKQSLQAITGEFHGTTKPS